MSSSQHKNLEKVQSNSELINSTFEGYQLTDIGILPKDWELKPLGDLTTLMTNGFVGTAKTHYTDSHDGVIYIQGYNVEENSFNFHGIKRVTAEFNKRHAKSNLRAGDLLMVQTGDVGLVTVVPPELAGSNCHALIISRFKTGLESKFFAYYLNSQQGRNRLKELETGTTMKHINVGDLLYFQVPVPLKVEEQTAIANALSDVDALIQELEKLIAKNQAIKTATMQQLLTGRTRLPQFAHHPDGRKKGYKPSELGEIPEDWEVVDFSKNVWFQEGPGVRQFQFTSSGVKLLNGTNIENGSLLLEKTQRHISEKLAYGQYAHFMIDEGDILIACSGVTIDKFHEKVTVAKKVDLPLCLNTSTMRFKPLTDKVDINYIKNFLKSEFFKDQIGGKATGSAQLNFGPYHVNQVIIALPEKREQIEIALVLFSIDEEIYVIEQRLRKTRQIKQGMMQELLTGKTRLVKPAGAA